MKLSLQYVAAPSVSTVPRLELISTYPVLDNIFKDLGDVLRQCSGEDFDNDQVSAVARGKFLTRGWALDNLRKYSFTKEQELEVTFLELLMVIASPETTGRSCWPPQGKCHPREKFIRERDGRSIELHGIYPERMARLSPAFLEKTSGASHGDSRLKQSLEKHYPDGH